MAGSDLGEKAHGWLTYATKNTPGPHPSLGESVTTPFGGEWIRQRLAGFKPAPTGREQN